MTVRAIAEKLGIQRATIYSVIDYLRFVKGMRFQKSGKEYRFDEAEYIKILEILQNRGYFLDARR